jgi:hypothetical protein
VVEQCETANSKQEAPTMFTIKAIPHQAGKKQMEGICISIVCFFLLA